jgi:hypothetical protein
MPIGVADDDLPVESWDEPGSSVPELEEEEGEEEWWDVRVSRFGHRLRDRLFRILHSDIFKGDEGSGRPVKRKAA